MPGFLSLYLNVNFLQVGAADYIAVAKNYHTVFIADIPVMSMRIRDKVTLIFLVPLIDKTGPGNEIT